MKKSLITCGLTALALVCSAVYADQSITDASATISPNQCPPLSAFSHKKFNGHWEIQDEYKKLGWYVSNTTVSDTVLISSLVSDTVFWANIKSFPDQNDKDHWYAVCTYDLSASTGGSAFPSKLIVANNKFLTGTPTSLPKSNFYTGENIDGYECNTWAGNLQNCSWDSMAK